MVFALFGRCPARRQRRGSRDHRRRQSARVRLDFSSNSQVIPWCAWRSGPPAAGRQSGRPGSSRETVSSPAVPTTSPARSKVSSSSGSRTSPAPWSCPRRLRQVPRPPPKKPDARVCSAIFPQLTSTHRSATLAKEQSVKATKKRRSQSSPLHSMHSISETRSHSGCARWPKGRFSSHWRRNYPRRKPLSASTPP